MRLKNEIELPWPYKGLSPNARCHWGARSRSFKKYKGDCKALASYSQSPAIVDGFMKFTVTFHPPSRRRTDLDNLISSAKALFDALAETWGVDDSIFRPEYRMGDIVKFGAVRVSV